MIEMSKPEVTVDALVARMRAVAARSRVDVAELTDAAEERAARSARVAARIDSAAPVAQVGRTFPPLAPFRGLLRYPARWAAHLVLFLSRFLTDAQASFNLAVLDALRDLNEAVRELERSPRHPRAAQTARAEAIDQLHFAMHDHLRGTPQMIRERLRVYLPLVCEPDSQAPLLPVLDLGCGRGEWLELLRDQQRTARGVDVSPAAVRQCQQRGLEAIEAEAIDYLQRLPDASLGAVTAVHLIEHLPFADLIQLVDETVRVLQPGGVAIFETPNPENVLVGSAAFYLDPTHEKPLPSAVVKFVAESRGLSQVEVLFLHASSDALPADGSALTDRFNALFYGPQDYAVVGRKL
jgi:SAM-dependent methyltransferase